MTIELTMLAWTVVLGLVHVVATGQAATLQHGAAYNLGPRDEQKPLTGIPGRVNRSFANFMQTFPFFVAVVLAAHLAGRHSWLTFWGVQLYFWGRLAFIPLYIFAVTGIRTAAFLVSTAGIVLILLALAGL